MRVSPEVTALAGAALGASTNLVRFKVLNRKTDAESAQVLATAYALFVDDLRKELTEVRKENAALRDRLTALETLLRSHGVAVSGA